VLVLRSTEFAVFHVQKASISGTGGWARRRYQQPGGRCRDRVHEEIVDEHLRLNHRTHTPSPSTNGVALAAIIPVYPIMITINPLKTYHNSAG
jgi:hypothetical protein